jgi:drug/metabolite transporter (DMT)-like permease
MTEDSKNSPEGAPLLAPVLVVCGLLVLALGVMSFAGHGGHFHAFREHPGFGPFIAVVGFVAILAAIILWTRK